MSTRKRSLVIGAIGAVAVVWYLALARQPQQPLAGTDAQDSDTETSLMTVGSSQPDPAATGTADELEQAAPSDPQAQPISEEERDARDFARGPIAEQPPEEREQYYTRLTEVLARSQGAKRASIDRLQAERGASDPVTRAAIDEAIRVREKVMAARGRDLAYANSQLPPSQ